MTPIVIGVAGGSGSGKTTVVRRIVESLGDDQVTVLEHDGSPQIEWQKKNSVDGQVTNEGEWKLALDLKPASSRSLVSSSTPTSATGFACRIRPAPALKRVPTSHELRSP
jgi:GTPase SAR1 family protein